jgi:hypothetical protein
MSAGYQNGFGGADSVLNLGGASAGASHDARNADAIGGNPAGADSDHRVGCGSDVGGETGLQYEAAQDRVGCRRGIGGSGAVGEVAAGYVEGGGSI